MAGTDNNFCLEPLPTNRYKGVGIFGGTPDGASAVPEHQVLHRCIVTQPLEIDGTFAYVNIQGPGTNDIVQIGEGDCRAPAGISCLVGGMHTFAGYGRTQSSPGCASYATKLPILPQFSWAGGTYQVYHTGNQWRLSAGGATLVTIAEAEVCWTANAATWFGESLDVGDAIGGSAADHLYVTSMKTTQTEGGAFAFTNFDSTHPCNITTAGTVYFCDIVGPSSFAVWTNFP